MSVSQDCAEDTPRVSAPYGYPCHLVGVQAREGGWHWQGMELLFVFAHLIL